MKKVWKKWEGGYKKHTGNDVKSGGDFFGMFADGMRKAIEDEIDKATPAAPTPVYTAPAYVAPAPAAPTPVYTAPAYVAPAPAAPTPVYVAPAYVAPAPAAPTPVYTAPTPAAPTPVSQPTAPVTTIETTTTTSSSSAISKVEEKKEEPREEKVTEEEKVAAIAINTPPKTFEEAILNTLITLDRTVVNEQTIKSSLYSYFIFGAHEEFTPELKAKVIALLDQKILELVSKLDNKNAIENVTFVNSIKTEFSKLDLAAAWTEAIAELKIISQRAEAQRGSNNDTSDPEELPEITNQTELEKMLDEALVAGNHELVSELLLMGAPAEVED